MSPTRGSGIVIPLPVASMSPSLGGVGELMVRASVTPPRDLANKQSSSGSPVLAIPPLSVPDLPTVMMASSHSQSPSPVATVSSPTLIRNVPSTGTSPTTLIAPTLFSVSPVAPSAVAVHPRHTRSAPMAVPAPQQWRVMQQQQQQPVQVMMAPQQQKTPTTSTPAPHLMMYPGATAPPMYPHQMYMTAPPQVFNPGNIPRQMQLPRGEVVLCVPQQFIPQKMISQPHNSSQPHYHPQSHPIPTLPVMGMYGHQHFVAAAGHQGVMAPSLRVLPGSPQRRAGKVRSTKKYEKTPNMTTEALVDFLKVAIVRCESELLLRRRYVHKLLEAWCGLCGKDGNRIIFGRAMAALFGGTPQQKRCRTKSEVVWYYTGVAVDENHLKSLGLPLPARFDLVPQRKSASRSKAQRR